jgi:hypothetical protein
LVGLGEGAIVGSADVGSASGVGGVVLASTTTGSAADVSVAAGLNVGEEVCGVDPPHPLRMVAARAATARPSVRSRLGLFMAGRIGGALPGWG